MPLLSWRTRILKIFVDSFADSIGLFVAGKRSAQIQLLSSARRWKTSSSTPGWRVLSAWGTDRFKRAALRRCRFGVIWILIEAKERNLSHHRVLCIKLSSEYQCSRVASDVADWKFNRTREGHRVSFAPAPLCLRRLGRPPHVQLRVQQQESAFPLALR